MVDSFALLSMKLISFQNRVNPQFAVGEKVRGPAIQVTLIRWSTR